mgnify:FL=1
MITSFLQLSASSFLAISPAIISLRMTRSEDYHEMLLFLVGQDDIMELKVCSTESTRS